MRYTRAMANESHKVPTAKPKIVSFADVYRNTHTHAHAQEHAQGIVAGAAISSAR